MNIYFDIGGTNFRYYICDREDRELIEKEIKTRSEDIFGEIYLKLGEISKRLDIDSITIGLPGIIKDSSLYGVNNIDSYDGKPLIREFNGVRIKYINDGDSYLLGALRNVNTVNRYNILGIVFGTGVGGGLVINKRLVYNAEVHQYFEKFMKENTLNDDNVDLVTSYIAIELKKIIQLLNLDTVFIGGYVNKHIEFKDELVKKLELSSFYNCELIFTHDEDVLLKGLMYYRKN